VFEDEPLIPEALCGLANVVLTPHVAAHAPEVQAVAAQLEADGVAASRIRALGVGETGALGGSMQAARRVLIRIAA